MTKMNEKIEFPVLIGDIGGTNARFLILSSPRSCVEDPSIFKTKNFANIDDALKEFFLSIPEKPKSAILAVAGLVGGDEFKLTNCSWIIQPKKILEKTGLNSLLIINDFEAQALSTAVLQEKDLKKIGGKKQQGDGPRLILGPGTGLGVCALFESLEKKIPIAGEGGHINIGPCTQRDYEIFPQIQKKVGRMSAEKILSGQGILNVYDSICCVDRKKLVCKTPDDVTKAALLKQDPVACETMVFFISCLARVASDLALIFMSTGGVFLTGGILQKILPLFDEEIFRFHFEKKDPHEEFLKIIPTFIIINRWAPLEGLAGYVRNPEIFQINRKNRFWKNV